MEFENLGARCSYSACRYQDYLPSSCSQCSQLFCQEHFRPINHDCAGQAQIAGKVNKKESMTCPFCNRLITYSLEKFSSPEKALSDHEKSGNCFEKKPRETCNAVSSKDKSMTPCKTKLTELNFFNCQECSQKVCLKCRMPEDHSCKEEIIRKKQQEAEERKRKRNQTEREAQERQAKVQMQKELAEVKQEELRQQSAKDIQQQIIARRQMLQMEEQGQAIQGESNRNVEREEKKEENQGKTSTETEQNAAEELRNSRFSNNSGARNHNGSTSGQQPFQIYHQLKDLTNKAIRNLERQCDEARHHPHFWDFLLLFGLLGLGGYQIIQQYM